MDTHGISVHRRHRETTDTMLAATRVCKKWAPIALDFLFKYLLIKSGDHAVEIATALEQQASRARAGACVGGRTVRLELALDGVHVWNEAHTLAFERIVAACSNITVLSTAFSTGSGPLVHTAALAHALELSELPSTLRRLELSGNGIVFDSILPRFSRSLDALWIRPTGHTELAKTTSGPVEFPRLLSLAVTAHRAVIPPKDWTMPRLLTLRMDSDLLSYLMGQTVQSFLEAQGPMLRILDVTRCPRMNLRFCPNLVDCTVPMSLLETLFANVPVPLSLRRLTFDRICEVRAAWIEPRSVMRFSLSMREEHEAGRLPPLESIRFLLPIAKRTMEPLQGTACLEIPYWECAVAELRQACGSLKIALETSIGADEHTANVWRPLSYEHFLGA
ncbi:hypothetical protein L226DRAFT_566854 [Lentinus tigrinus ALCF2SS1-7]|uniref:F-box domain-containing protein n=1 Tax=Lentinus tigrinus ALCF2SS1-6 TaxID=1328759 RepID=A0A5C2SRY3_9APHY|nr:hypothetical protein L227DRAFT_649146 [Lentinus tigrinus ALCF2SS1-6]RPD80354.1 hypothetical protein L226DRAFT_566854 [Lentinus tigrinus ALCF2SS1-7]